MADTSSLLSPTTKFSNPIPAFFSAPRLFTPLSSKGLSETDAVKSPTSILDSKPFSATNKHPWDSRGIAIAIADALNDEILDHKFSKPDTPMVLFGSQLKIQIPSFSLFPPSPTESPNSPTDFGIKTRPSSLLDSSSGSPTLRRKSSFTGCLSASQMESSEEYTCVITHGPNPKTTHIFDDCIVEDCCGVIGLSGCRKQQESDYSSQNFLSFCYTCKKNLGQGNDIYIYRGEKAFCSHECRYQEILLEERMEKSEREGSFRTYY